MLAVLDGGEHQLAGGIDATDQLHEDVDVRIRRHRKDIPGQSNTVNIAGRIVATGANMGNLDGTTHTAGNIPRVAFQHVDGA